MTTDTVNPGQDQYDPQKYRVNLRLVLASVAVFYLAAILLNANGIMRDLELLRYGKVRDAGIAIFHPIADFSNKLGLTKFRTIIEKSIGNRMRNEKIKM
jgi:hypothetical protein